MRVLFVHEGGAFSGVTAQLAWRLGVLARRGMAEVALAERGSAARALTAFGPVHLEPDPARLAKLSAARRHDLVVLVDAPRYYRDLRKDTAAKVALEVRDLSPPALSALEPCADACGVLVPSVFAREHLTDRLGLDRTRLHVVPPAIDPELFRPGTSEAVGPPILLWVGRLERDDWQSCVEIAALLALADRPFELWMVGGEGSSEACVTGLVETVEGLGLMSRFRWFRALEHGVMGRLYRAVAARGGCLLETAREVSFGTPVAEALASGLLAIAPAVGALEELAGEGVYLGLYTPGDVDGAAALVGETLTARRALLEHALVLDRPAFAARFAPEVVEPRLVAALEGILGHPTVIT